tara:strand:- start:474 stop:743 length:270 start_codon:yes stop_codon:yes gene_type:complete
MSRKVFYPLLLLFIPLIGMNFTDEIDWSLSDFIVAGLILLVFSICTNFIILRISNTNRRVLFITILLILFMLVWAELAVGIFGTPFAGS